MDFPILEAAKSLRAADPHITLQEMAEEISQSFGLRLSATQLSKYLKAKGLSTRGAPRLTKSNCENCGKEIVRGLSAYPARFCSAECYADFSAREGKGTRGPFVCPECGEVFLRYYPKTKLPTSGPFCSVRCSTLWKRRQGGL